MSAAKIKKGDSVVVLSGKDKGRTGTVRQVMPKEGKVVVEGVNMVTKHQKARNAMQPGGIVHMEAPIDASNVMLVCPKCGKGTRVAHKVVVVEENGVKKRKIIRVCKQKGCGAEID